MEIYQNELRDSQIPVKLLMEILYMKDLIRLTDYSIDEIREIFSIDDEIDKYKGILEGKTVVMFFPNIFFIKNSTRFQD